MWADALQHTALQSLAADVASERIPAQGYAGMGVQNLSPYVVQLVADTGRVLLRVPPWTQSTHTPDVPCSYVIAQTVLAASPAALATVLQQYQVRVLLTHAALPERMEPLASSAALLGSNVPWASGVQPWTTAPEVTIGFGGGGGAWEWPGPVENTSGANSAAAGVMGWDASAGTMWRLRIVPGTSGIQASPYSGLQSVAITTATTTAVKASAGVVGTLSNASGAVTGTITVYDNTAASGKTLWSGTLAAGQVLALGIPCGTGITVLTAAADAIAVSYA